MSRRLQCFSLEDLKQLHQALPISHCFSDALAKSRGETLPYTFLYSGLLRCSLMDMCSHSAGVPSSDLVPKCQAPGGLSCPAVPRLASLPPPSLKALTFTRRRGAARGSVTFVGVFHPRGKRACRSPVRCDEDCRARNG